MQDESKDNKMRRRLRKETCFSRKILLKICLFTEFYILRLCGYEIRIEHQRKTSIF